MQHSCIAPNPKIVYGRQIDSCRNSIDNNWAGLYIRKQLHQRGYQRSFTVLVKKVEFYCCQCGGGFPLIYYILKRVVRHIVVTSVLLISNTLPLIYACIDMSKVLRCFSRKKVTHKDSIFFFSKDSYLDNRAWVKTFLQTITLVYSTAVHFFNIAFHLLSHLTWNTYRQMHTQRINFSDMFLCLSVEVYGTGFLAASHLSRISSLLWKTYLICCKMFLLMIRCCDVIILAEPLLLCHFRAIKFGLSDIKANFPIFKYGLYPFLLC